MSTRNKTALIAVLLALTISIAWAGIGQNVGGGISQFDNGVSYGGSGGFTPTCDGTIDLSTGCPLPMLGVI